jgi:hypothetical protein
LHDGKKDFREKPNFTGAHARKGNTMITIEYSVKINENEEIIYLTNVEKSLFEQTLFILLKCGYLINNITYMKQ